MRELETRIAIAARAAALLILSLGPVDRALAQSAAPPQQPGSPQSAVPQTPPAPAAPPVVVDPATVRLELRIFDGPDDVTAETRVRLFPRGQRTNDLPTTTAPGQAITATVPVGFYDAQAIREKRGEVAGQTRLRRAANPPVAGRGGGRQGLDGSGLPLGLGRHGERSRQGLRRRRRPAVRAAGRKLRCQTDDGRQDHAVDARHRGPGGPDAPQDVVDGSVLTLSPLTGEGFGLTLGER
jgi:hypothetical protein